MNNFGDQLVSHLLLLSDCWLCLLNLVWWVLVPAIRVPFIHISPLLTHNRRKQPSFIRYLYSHCIQIRRAIIISVVSFWNDVFFSHFYVREWFAVWNVCGYSVVDLLLTWRLKYDCILKLVSLSLSNEAILIHVIHFLFKQFNIGGRHQFVIQVLIAFFFFSNIPFRVIFEICNYWGLGLVC